MKDGFCLITPCKDSDMSAFKNYAEYYDLLYRDKDYVAEVAYVDECIQRYHPGAESLLELGCGTGIHAEHLAKRNYFVHGVDKSAEMLKNADSRWSNLDSKVSKRLSNAQGDFQSLQLNRKFEAIVALFHVVSYLSLNDDLEAAFSSAAHHLDKGGVFLFDCWYGPAVLTDLPVVRVKELEGDTISALRVAVPTMHPNENLVDVHYKINIKENKSECSKTIEEHHHMRYFFLPELEYLLSKTGFELLLCEEWLTGKKPGFDTWSIFVVAKRV